MSNLREKKASDANFTNITFDDIKNKLLTRIKTYYPDTYQDFNKSSFGAMMVDLMAMMSEQLGFYSQFVANENYVETSRSSYSFYSHAARAGGNIFNEYVSTGHVKVYSLAPVTTPAGTVDTRYKHTILKGAKFVTDSGAVYTSTEDAIIEGAQKTLNNQNLKSLLIEFNNMNNSELIYKIIHKSGFSIDEKNSSKLNKIFNRL